MQRLATLYMEEAHVTDRDRISAHKVACFTYGDQKMCCVVVMSLFDDLDLQNCVANGNFSKCCFISGL